MRMHAKSFKVLLHLFSDTYTKVFSSNVRVTSCTWMNHTMHSYGCYFNVKWPNNKVSSHLEASGLAPCWAGFPIFLELLLTSLTFSFLLYNIRSWSNLMNKLIGDKLDLAQNHYQPALTSHFDKKLFRCRLIHLRCKIYTLNELLAYKMRNVQAMCFSCSCT